MGANTATVQKLYVAFFNRPGDALGQAFWEGKMDAGMTEAQVAASFAQSTEYTSVYGSLTTAQTVSQLYTNLFGRSAAAGEITFWGLRLLNGQETVASIARTLANSAQGTDADAITNKIAAATSFTNGLTTSDQIVGYSGAAANAVAKAWLATVTNVASTLTAATASLSATIASATTAGSNSTGTTFTLTTGVDNLTGTSANDTFNAIIDNFGAAATTTAGTRTTLSLGDAIDGGSGTDTVNILTNLTGGTTIPVATLKNVEIVNVNNVAPLAADVVTIAASNAPQATQFNATGPGSLTVTGIGSAAIGSNGVAAQTAANVTTITAAGANTINIQNTTTAASAAGTIKFDVSNGSGAAAQAVVVNTLGTTANVINDIKIGNATVGAASLTINAASNLKTTTVTEFVANTLKTVTISGAATTVDLGTLPSTALTSVDASGLTAGGAKVTLGTNLATTFKGGAGNDTLTIAAGAAMTGAADAGAGSDTLAISDNVAKAGGAVTDTSLTATTGKLFTNFEILQVAATATGSGTQAATDVATFDPTLMTGITSFNVATSTAGVKLINLAAAPTINVVGDVKSGGGLAGINAVLKDATGTSDVVNFTISNGKTDSTITNNGLTIDKITAAGVETINIASNGLVSNSGTANTVSSLDLDTSLALSKVVLTGSQNLSLTTGTQTTAKDLTIDGSAATGQLTINATGVAGKANINGGTASDTITVTNSVTAGGSVYGGAGGDSITLNATKAVTLVYKAATDSLADAVNAAGSAKGTQDAIVTFTTAVDKIDISSFGFTAAQKGALVYDATVYANEAKALAAAAANTTFFNDASNTARAVKVVTDGTNAYVFVDVNKDGAFSATSDMVIQLTGITTADATKVALADFNF